MPHSIELFEELIDDENIVIPNPCLRWNAASAVLEADQKENRILLKRKVPGRIDGVVASAMAIGTAEGELLMMATLMIFFSNPLSM